MNKKVTAPDYCLADSGCVTQRAWRRYKRAHLRALRQALERLKRGCVFTPSTEGEIGLLNTTVTKLERLWSPKEWGA